MRDEPAFLQAILANPTDDQLLLVYADWLEEQAEPVAAAKAEFLRLTVLLATEAEEKSPTEPQRHLTKSGRRSAKAKANARKRQTETRRLRLQQLAAQLDTNWLGAVSRLAIENCAGKRVEAEGQRSYPLRFDYLCERRWEELQTTENGAVRFCDGCQQHVHYCGTIMQAREHAAARHCIAVDLGVLRREDDLEPQRFWLGWSSAETLRREAERMQPDAVSAERARRKQAQGLTSEAGEGMPKVRPTRTAAVGRPTRGGRVRVRDGTFAGMEGEVVEIRAARGTVRVQLTIFGRPVPVELEYWQVE